MRAPLHVLYHRLSAFAHVRGKLLLWTWDHVSDMNSGAHVHMYICICVYGLWQWRSGQLRVYVRI